MKRIILVLFTALLFTGVLKAQDRTFNKFDIGMGMGINYGGLGYTMAFAPIPYISIEGSFGYNLVEPVVGGAINVYVIPKDNTKLYSLAVKSMYGYNAAILVADGDLESKSFYGFSFGLSNEIRFGKRKRIGINLDLIIPLRSNEVDEYCDELAASGYETADLFPIGMSLGFHFEF